ncbi:hypothetical protein [Cetobacterium sp.]|uniref:hypothetical protein n=1 Tax=Cetobacterium sp. TaxID=2071632 RepID=UPI003EE46066
MTEDNLIEEFYKEKIEINELLLEAYNDLIKKNTISLIVKKKIFEQKINSVEKYLNLKNEILLKELIDLKTKLKVIISDIENFIKNNNKKNIEINYPGVSLILKGPIFKIFFTVYIAIIVIIVGFILTTSEYKFSKLIIQNNMKMAIKNKANAETLKNILKLHPQLSFQERIDSLFYDSEKNYYYKDIQIEEILHDLINENYLSENFDDELNKKLKELLDENKKIEPITLLPKNEAEYFINIKNKLSEDSYTKIENDITKIIENASSKNQLIQTYLNQSEKSYIISIIGLIIAVITFPVAFLQLIQFIKNLKKFFLKKEESLEQQDENTEANKGL